MWFIFGLIGTIIARVFFTVETPRISKEESKNLGLVVVWTSTICMWLFWSFVYMHQLIPLMTPLRPQVP